MLLIKLTNFFNSPELVKEILYKEIERILHLEKSVIKN